jgi:type II secretory pathway pseudopilin PulG
MISKKAFSLVEVVVAVGIFALAIVGVIGLLSPTNKAVADVAESDAASRVISAIQAGLQQTGFDNVRTKLTAAAAAPQYVFGASKSGDKVGFAVGETGTIFTQPEDQFFEFALIRNETLSPNVAPNLDTSAGFLAFTISLRWPAYLPNGTKFNANEQKSVLIVPAAITR